MNLNNPFIILLDISACAILLGLGLAGIYEALAILNLHIPFTPNIPLITDMVRPWVMAHKPLALGLAAIAFGGLFWLFFHFFLSA